MGTVFCGKCDKPVLEGWIGADGKGYHREHPEPHGPVDPPVAGRCAWGGGHPAPAIWQTPRDGKYFCLDHLSRIVRVATWKGKSW